jgi:autotransporter-associated beta strand protein
MCVIHDMEGYYWGSISYLNRCDLNTNGSYNVSASVHFLANGVQNGPGENNPSDPPAGEITQTIYETNYAWHAVCLNKYSFGTEHEGFVSNPAWFTETMYQSSAALQRHLCDKFGIAKDRNHIIGHNEWQNPTWTAWLATNIPAINPTCNNHTDPGVFWHWSHFMALITNGNTNIGTYWDPNGATPGAGSAPSGTWDLASYNWTTDPNGAIAPGLWTGQTAIFSTGSDATGAYTITVSGVQAANHVIVRTGTVTFSGGQLNFIGFGSYYSNYVAAGATAIYNTPFGGTGSPDKWGPGTAVYNGANASGGYFTLNEGTLALGNNSALSTNYIVIGDSSGAKFVTLKSADSTARTISTKLVFNANSFSFGAGGDLTFTGPIDVSANSAAATVIVVSNSTTTLSGPLTNTAGFTKSGPGTLVLSGTGANTYGSTSANGNTTVNAGTLKLSKTAGIAAVPNGSLILNTGGTLLLGAANQIGDAVPMTLAGGTFQTAGFSEQLGTLALTGNSVIDLGAGASVLKVATSSGVAWTTGRTLTISNWTGSIKGAGTDQVFVGTTASGLSSTQLGLIRFANPAGFPPGSYAATILSTGAIVPASTVPAIATQPQDTIAVAGGTVTFTFTASGTPPPAYQWYFGGTTLAAATNTNLVLPNVTTDRSGNYFAVATNIAGAVTSRVALLTVYPTAAATLASPAYLAGSGSFQLSVTGVPTYNYAILASTDLNTWAPLLTNPSPFIFADTNSPAFPCRFYRAQYVP